ncbi:hypothetical protein OFO01_07315 [Campylobacter sp. JMF_01 NE2]|uniref:hypothetical protein n=1 Tax=unclassified Campylobacter TaxID=2593542 RepID=UPI0022E9B0A6|nr:MULTISPECIES: hypothetical protein [unclassified Campylobacter]MDA3053227.1 hypothetical protein [Campylobacter sp. JMF_03 NE3]MDA3067590.1 hypothetical protein [Campylobacter sp. JMF_01 NE2]
MALTQNKVEKVAEALYFNVDFTKDTNGNKSAEFSTYSPCGQDFNFSIDYKKISDLPEEIHKYYHAYDPSYETSLWIDSEGHGKNGAPYEIGDIYEDMKWCEASIKELYEELQKVA